MGTKTKLETHNAVLSDACKAGNPTDDKDSRNFSLVVNFGSKITLSSMRLIELTFARTMEMISHMCRYINTKPD